MLSRWKTPRRSRPLLRALQLFLAISSEQPCQPSIFVERIGNTWRVKDPQIEHYRGRVGDDGDESGSDATRIEFFDGLPVRRVGAAEQAAASVWVAHSRVARALPTGHEPALVEGRFGAIQLFSWVRLLNRFLI